MARGKRPVTFRTRKLSLSAPMVLPWRRGGRVGRRRTTIPEGPPPPGGGPSAFHHPDDRTPRPESPPEDRDLPRRNSAYRTAAVAHRRRTGVGNDVRVATGGP